MHNLKTNYDKIYQICSELLKNELMEGGYFRKYTHYPKLTDLSVLSIMLTAEILGIDSENHLYSKIKTEYPTLFCGLMHRTNYNRRKRHLQQYVPLLLSKVSSLVDKDQDSYILDSIPLPVCSFVRASRSKVCKEGEVKPAKSYHASHKIYYYGFKMQMLLSKSGIPVFMGIAAGNVHDIHVLKELNDGQFSDCELIADKGYISVAYQTSLFEEHRIKLITPLRSNMKKSNNLWTPTYRFKRKRIETLFAQLCDQFMLKRNYAKSLNGLFARICVKIAGVAVLQYSNFKENRPINWLKHALAA